MINKITKLVNYIAFAIIFFSAAISFAQPIVVRVPPTCNVVVPGIGGTPGYGQAVGDGGIVCMPDPFDDPSSNGDFYAISGAASITSWTLLGDLSEQTNNTPPSAGTYSAGPVTFLNIESYNKNLRLAEDGPGGGIYPLSDPIWARSKGRVIINYTLDPCDDSITFEVYKNYDSSSWVPPIVGPNCLQPNSTYTFSVDQISSDNAGDAIGFDDYYWSGLPAGATNVYTSADNSSITFSTGPTVSATTLVCCYGRCNDWDGNAGGPQTNCVTKTLNILPSAPNFSSSQPVNSCLNTGVTSFPIVISSPVAGYIYALSAPGTPWVITNNSLGNWTVTTGSDNNPGTLLLSVSNGFCSPVIFSYPINRRYVAPSASISSATCLNAGSSNNAFSIASNAVLNPTTWGLPPGWAITPGSANGTSTIVNLTVPPGTPAGQYTISASTVACPTGVITRIVNVRPATPVFLPSTPTCVVRGTTPITSIGITPIPGVSPTGYTWTITPAGSGWTCSANCNTVNPTFIPNGTTAGPVTITVTAGAVAGCTSTASRTINYSPVLPASITNSCFNFGVAGTTTITVGNRPIPFYGTFTVSSSPAGLFSTYSVSPTGIITLNTLATASGNYTLTITHTTTACGSLSTTYPVTVNGNGASMNITANVPGPQNCDQYTVFGTPAGSVLTWYVNGITGLGTQIGNTLTLCGTGTPPTSVCVNVASGGCITRVCAPVVGTHSGRNENTNDNGINNSLLDEIKIYPNPNDGNFSILVPDFKESASALLADNTGREIATFNLTKGENKIENELLASGTYLVILKIDGQEETRQIIVK